VARYAPDNELPRLAEFARGRIPDRRGLAYYQELERQFVLFKSIDEGLQQRGRALPDAVRDWGAELVKRFFAALDTYHSWIALPYEPNPTANPWGTEQRIFTDGRKCEVTSSLPHGEQLTGVLRSKEFTLPERLSFWLCGHDGFPDKPAQKLNRVRLRASPSGEVLAETLAPRNDMASPVTWSLAAQKGSTGYVEVVDGNTDSAYAWIAFGGFEPELPQLRPSEFAPRKMNDWLMSATDTAVRLRLKEYAPIFARFAVPTPGASLDQMDPDLVGTVVAAWVALTPGEAVKALSVAVLGTNGSALYRERVAEVLAGQNSPEAQAAVVAVLRSSSLKSQEKLASALVGTKFGADTLLAAAESGGVSSRVLQRAAIRNKIQSAKPTDWETRLVKLTKSLPPADEARDKLIAERRGGFARAHGKVEAGRQIFVRNCAVCHRIGDEGALVGPQLDGIGQRGLDRLCEDVLDPNRNVDRAFRTTLLTLEGGDIASGLFRREEGELVILADATGKENAVPKKNIVERHESETSLMPENFGDLLPPDEFNSLMAFLLSKSAQKQ
jgi:putative heme-binding domain-containing protein